MRCWYVLLHYSGIKIRIQVRTLSILLYTIIHLKFV